MQMRITIENLTAENERLKSRIAELEKSVAYCRNNHVE